MAQIHKNNVSGVLASQISAVATSMTLVDASSFPDPGADFYLVTLIGLNGNGQESSWEIVKVTGKASNTLTIVRAQELTTAVLWPVATTVQMRLTAGGLAGKEDAISAGTTAQYWRGDKTWRDFFTDVRAATLTGLSTVTNAAITATDTVLSALGKLQKQITELTTTVSSKGDASTNTASSVDSEVALFSGTGGKTLKRATGSGLTKLTSGVLGTATAGTDYVAPGTQTTFTAIQNFAASGITLKGSSTGVTTFASANASATNYTITFPASTGTVLTTAAAVTVAQGGTGATTLTGILKGNGTSAFTAATAGTDYQAPIGTISGLAKGNGANALTSAVANTDYVSPTGADGLLTRWMFQDCAWDFYDSATTNALNFTNGSHQRWAPNTGAQTLSITNWPPSGNLGELLIEGVNLGAATITWPTINWIKSDGTTTTTFSSNGVTLQTSGTDWVLLWTRDAGTTIYGKVVR